MTDRAVGLNPTPKVLKRIDLRPSRRQG